MYKLGHLENNGQNQDVSQCNNRDVFTGHNMNNTSCSLSSPPSDNATKSTTTSVLRRWRRPDTHDSGTKHVPTKNPPASEPSKYVNVASAKQMNQVGNYVGNAETSSANPGSDYSMFVPQLSPVVPQSTARPYDSTKYLPHVQYGENGGYAGTSPVGPSQSKLPDKASSTGQSSYYHQDGTNQEVHFRSPNYPIQNTPPLAHSASQKCILPNENNTYSVTNQKVTRDYVYPHRDYSVVAHNYSPQKINPADTKMSPQGGEDPSYCLSKPVGYVQDSRISPQNMTHSYPLNPQNAIDRRVSPHNPKSPIYRNYPQNNGSAVMDSRINIPTQNYPTSKSSGEYVAQNTSYYMEKPPCVSQKQGYPSEKQVLDARYVQNYNQNYVVSKNQLVTSPDSKHPRDYRNVTTNSKKASPPFPILEQRLNQEANYCADYSQGYYPSKYRPVMFSRTSPTPKMVRDGSVAGHNYIPSNVHHNTKIPPQDVMISPNYSFPNKYYQQNQGQEWKIPKEYEQNMYLSQMNQMNARLPHNTISKTTDLPRDLSYVDQNQRMVAKGRMYCSESSPVEHLQYTGKSVVPVTQKSPKMVGYNISDQRTPENLPNDYLNIARPCGTVMKPSDYQRSSKVGEYGPVIQSVKAAELGYDPKQSRDYMMHQQSCRNEIPSDQQSYVCSPPLMGHNSRNPPPYPVGYLRQSNIKLNEMPARNISPRRTFQENMPVVVFSPQHIGLPKSSPSQIYPSEYLNPQHYPGYYPRDSVYPGSGVKSGMPQYPVDQSGKYANIHVNRNVPQQRFPFGYPEHQYYQHKHLESPDKHNYYPGNMYRTHYNPNLPEHLQQNVSRPFEGDYRNAASNYNDFEANRVDERAVYSKKDSDIGKSLKEFLESWEDDEEIVANLPDLVLCNNIPPDKQKLPFAGHSEEASETSKSSSDEDSPKGNESEQPLYILGSTNISSEALPQYLAVYEQVDRLPDNIKGFYKGSSLNSNEEAQSANVENKEKPIETPPDPKSVIRDSSSPHDLTVNKNRDEKKIDEEEVLNLSTNRNKEDDEFLVEEYSNASEDNTSVQDHQEPEKETPADEPDTSYSEIEKSPEKEVSQNVEPIDDNQEPAKDSATSEETSKNIQDTDEHVRDVKETIDIADEDRISLSENSSLPDGKDCLIMVPLTDKKRQKSENKNDDTGSPSEHDKSSDKEENRDEEQPKIPSDCTTEKSLTASVIVPNKFFDNTLLISKIDLGDKLPIIIGDPIDITDNECEESAGCIPEISVEEPKEIKSELTAEKTTELVENANLNIPVLDEIEDNKSSIDEAAEENIDSNIDIDVIDFVTAELLPQNDSKIVVIDKSIENEIEEDLEPISFDNLINSPENIEMKDDEDITTDLENNTECFTNCLEDKHVNSLPSPPRCLDLSLPESDSEIEKEIPLLEDIAEITEEVILEIPENAESMKSDILGKDLLPSPQSDSENIPEENTVNLVDNIVNIDDVHIEIIPERFETQPLNHIVTCDNNNAVDDISVNLKEKNNEDNSKCASLLSFSPIPDCDIKVESEEIELKTTDDILDEIEAPSSVYTDEEIIEDVERPETEYTETKVKEETKEQIPEELELVADLQSNEEIVESENPFESTVDKLIITNVETIQDDSSDFITQEETIDKPILEETNNALNEDVRELEVPVPDLEESENNEDDTVDDEFVHLEDIVKTKGVLVKEEYEKDSEDLKENSVDVNLKTEDVNNFDFSYLESCTDNICEKSEDATEKICNRSSADKNKHEQLCNNDTLKSLLDSSDSNEGVVTPDKQSEHHSDFEKIVKSEENMDSLPEISTSEDSESLEKPEKESATELHLPETEETQIVSVSNELPQLEIPIPESDIPVAETETQEQFETSENQPEVPMSNNELPETTTEIIPVETVEENLSNSVIVTENVTSEENIILPENSECVVIYSEDEQYLIIQPATDTAEIVPSEELVDQETEIIIPEVPSEVTQKEEELIVEQVTAEPVGEEIIICEEGIEDWIQNEEIIESNEEDAAQEAKLDTDQINAENKELFLNQEEIENIEPKDTVLQNKDKLKKIKLSLEKKKLLATKRKKKIEKQEMQTRLTVIKITETFINEEKIFSYPDSVLTNCVEEKELFMNPENPDTIEYNNNSSGFPFPDSTSVIKRRVSYVDFSSPKIDFKAPKRRYSSMESTRSVKKPIINLDEISKNITEVLANLTKQETIQYQNMEKVRVIEPKLEVKKEVEVKIEVKEEEKEVIMSELSDVKEEKIDQGEKEFTSKSDIKVNIKPTSEDVINNHPNDIKVSDNISSPNHVTKLVEQLIKPKLIIPKTNFHVVTSPDPPLPNRKPALLKTPEIKEDNSSPVLNTARLTEPIFPKSSVPETKTKRPNVDPRIDRPKELPEKEEKLSLIENKLSNTFGLTEYTKNYIKMKTGQTVDPKILCGINGSKVIDPRLTIKPADQSTSEVKLNTSNKKLENVVDNINNDDSKNNEKKIKINLQDYRNRKSQSSDSNSTENSMSSPQAEDVAMKDSEEIKPDETLEKSKIPNRKVEKLKIKPKKSSDPLLTQEINKVTTSPEDPKVTKSTNNHQIDCNNLKTDSNVNSKSKIDLKQNKPKKRKRRFRNLYTVDDEDEVPTKQSKNSLDNIETKLNGLLTTNEDSTSSSKISEDSQQSAANSSSGSKMNEDSQSSEMSSGTNGEFLCCLDLNPNGTTENNCGFKCHIKLNAIGEKIRDYEINKNSCSNPNRLKLTLKPVKKKKPAFSEVLSNLDSLVESELHSKRKRKLNGSNNSVNLDNSEKNGDGTLWTIKNKVPKVIIKRNGSGYCAVFRDVSSNPIWQPKIRLKRQKYIESLVLRNNVKF